MDRVTEYFGALVRETDGLTLQQNVMTAAGWLANASVGPAQNTAQASFPVMVDGFTCVPTSPATLTVNLTPGAVYQIEPLEATAWSSLLANTTQQIVKQGLMNAIDNISTPAPTTVGFSQVYLIETQYQDLDTNPVLLPYFNSANPANAFSGPGNNGQSQNTARQGIAAIQLKAGTPAATGTQVAPTADAGWTPLFTITVAQGQTTVTAGNISMVNTAPWVPTKLPIVPSSVLNGNWVYCTDTGAVNALVGNISSPGFVPSTLTPGMQVRLRIANTNTGATTFNFNGTGAASVVRASGAALQANDLVASEVADLTYDGAHWQITNFVGTTPGTTNNNTFTTGLPYVVDSGTVNNIVAAFSPAIGSTNQPTYTAGLAVIVKLANTVTGPTKITVNTFAQTNVIMPDGTAIQANDLKAGMALLLIYDGTNFQVASWQDATTPLRVLEVAGSGQSVPALNVDTIITCWTSVNRNTLQTSTWNGATGTFTVGAGEDGLWAIYAFQETFPYGPTGDSNIIIVRTRGASVQWYYQSGTAISQPNASMVLDLQVGDIIQFHVQQYTAGTLVAIANQTSNAVLYRILGAH